jgi:modulator of FtsH protease HflC
MSNIRTIRPPQIQFGPGDAKFLTILLVVIILGWAAFSNLLIVQENEYRVIRSWTGEVQRVITEAGPAFKIPFIESSQSLPRTKNLYDGKLNEILTADQKPIIVDNYAVWQITDPLAFVQNTQSLTNAEERIDSAVYSTVRIVLGRQGYGDIVSEGESTRGDLTAEVTKLVNESLLKSGNNYGIVVHDVRIKRTDLPDQNIASVYSRMKSDRARIAADYLSQGDEQATKIKAGTDREAAVLVAEATRTAKEIEAEGESEAARIYNEAYGANPEFYSLYRTLESYRTTLSGKPAIVIPIDSPYASLLMGR